MFSTACVFYGIYRKDQARISLPRSQTGSGPSLCLEAFGLVVIEAMSHGVPVIASRTGSLSEVVDDGLNGLLFEPGNARDLAEKIAYLWNRPSKCREMGGAGREKASKEYSENVYYDRLMAVYMSAIERNREDLRENQ